MKLFQLHPLSSGQPASATVSTPGSARRCSATCSQYVRGLRALGDRLEGEDTVGGKARGLMRQPLEGGDKQPGDEKHQKTEGRLHGDEGMHQAAPRVRVFSAFQRAHRLDGRGAQRRRQTEEQA